MERALFASRLREAAIAARDFGRTFVRETLPDPIVFRVRLNRSYDGNPLVGDEVVFPEDDGFARSVELAECDAALVVDTLWRAGRVPEWINVTVIGETGTATLLELLCCGRYTGDDKQLYHLQEGRPPFHVLGLDLPPRHQPGQRFSIYQRSECWSTREVERVGTHADGVWALDLVGGAFDDAALAALPDLPNMELLELKASPIHGRALVGLARFPRLRIVRIALAANDAFHIPPLPANLGALERFELSNAPHHAWGLAELFTRAPALSTLWLEASGDLFLDGPCPPGLQSVSVRGARVDGEFRPPASLEALHVHLSETGDEALGAWLSSTRSIRELDLDGTPITDAFAETLPARFGLGYLNVVRTGVSAAAIDRIADASPTLKLLPRRKRRAP